MFSIFTPTGRAFLGSLEDLRRVSKTAASKAISSNQKTLYPPIEDKGEHEFEVPKKAIEQYKQLLENTGEREPALHAYQIMSKNVSVLMADWSFTQALTAFKRFPYQLMPIVSANGILVGSLSRREIYEYEIEHAANEAERNRSIAELFLTQDSMVYSAEPVTDVRRIASILVEDKLDALPITTDAGRIIGIVSRTDLLACLVNDPPFSLWC